MRHPCITKLVPALVTACFAAITPLAVAQENYLVDNFDDVLAFQNWGRWWGGATQTYTDGEGMDAGGDINNSGSLRADIGFDYAAYGGDNQFCLVRYFDEGVIDGTLYTNLVFELYWDASSPKNAGGNFGTLELGLVNNDYGTITTYYTIPGDSGGQWVHIEAAMDPATSGMGTIRGVFLKIWAGNDASALTGDATFWVDDVMLLADTSSGPPPVEVSMTPASPGLQIFASAAGQQWQRQSIRTLVNDPDGAPNNYSWVGKATPKSYSFTLTSFPGEPYQGFQSHVFLVPESTMPNGPDDGSIDWNAPNVIFMDFYSDGGGNFRYKTNQPGNNQMIFNDNPDNGAVGTLASLDGGTILGTWTVTFENDTDITLSGPNGASTNFTMGAEAAALFADPLVIYFGVQPNDLARIGQSATYSRMQITGPGGTLDDSFAGPDLDADLWAVIAADPSGVVLVPADTPYWARWNAPATGHVLQTSPDLSTWTTPDLTPVQIGTMKSVLVPQSALPSPNAFLRTIKPEAPPAP